MKFLVDQNLSPRIAEALADLGHDAVHTSDCGLAEGTDREVVDRARTDGRVLVSADTDFGTVLATTRATSPSVLLIRRSHDRGVDQIVAAILAVLPQVQTELRAGAVVVLAGVVRVPMLPIV